MSVPIATSPGRSDFGPQLLLSYNSGAGNGPFGLGWNLSLPTITRKTDKGPTQYHDTEGADVFILSGIEDLIVFTRALNRIFEVGRKVADDFKKKYEFNLTTICPNGTMLLTQKNS